MDYRSRNGLPANEKVDSRIAYDDRATRKKRINHLLSGSKRGHQCRPDDGEGREANTQFNIRQPSTARCQKSITLQWNKLVLALTDPPVQRLRVAGLITHQSRREWSSPNALRDQVPRSENKKADALIVEEEGDTWMTPIFKYLSLGGTAAKREGKKQDTVKRKSGADLGSMHAGNTSVVGKGLVDWLLLANHARGRKKVNSSMSRLPSSHSLKLFPRNPSTTVKPQSHISRPFLQGVDMTIVGPFSEGQRKGQILDNLDSQGKSSQITKSSSKTIHSRIGTEEMCIQPTNLLLVSTYPQTNGLVERATCSFGEGIKG
ncbi:hypothetical protein Tco_0268646 [Tanacetum coccineum]